ncbi:MAG: valine--tRNA ligase [Deltaproteobacteria bacterium]|nr:valine--tRNA ligase [Deltaproteobacteria bacterium]
MALIDDIPKNFEPKDVCDTIYAKWEAGGMFRADPNAGGEPYSIVIPPPNVTGSLHMGHALNNTLQDVLVRYKRMDGFNTLWVPGTDHAGIATQWIVEKQLRAKGIDRRAMGREAFLETVWAWKAESGGTITHQLRKLGVSCDWSRERFTMDEGLSRAVIDVFVRYYEEGLIYRAERLINWDPIGLTALSDLEVEAEEGAAGALWSFAYPLSAPAPDAEGNVVTEVIVATTRPETMLGDTAVAVHPDDPRFKHLIGKTVRHPILDREIPIIGDAILVDPSFGSGAVKITPAHDFNDFEVGKRHNLPMINIFNLDATVNANGGPYQGLDRFVARDQVKAKIEELGLFRGSQPHVLNLPRSQRSGAIVEPMLSTQWFVRMQPLAGPALAAVEHGFTKFVPKAWENTYYSWMRNIKDWCISRQLWWGHRIPAWYDPEGKAYVGRSEEEVRQKNGLAADLVLRQDEDVLDTWFSSALWPFSTLGWPDKTQDLAKYYPTSVLVTGFDIIFFWVARMIYSGQHFMGQVPFKDVYIHALVRDEHGQKMSKTKGNVVDPLESIALYGADAFRFTLVALAAQGRDILWSSARAEGNVKFQNKVWQAFRYTMMQLDGWDPTAPATLSPYDHWILARMGEAVRRVRAALDEYRFNEVAAELYSFTWDELCSWYLELTKATFKGEDPSPEAEAARQGTRGTLHAVFHGLVRLLHPIMPFLTEELWGRLPRTEGSVMTAAFPKAADYPNDPAALIEVKALQEAIVEVRRVRSAMGLADRKPALIARCADPALLRRHLGALRDLCGVEAVEQGGPGGVVATIVVQGQEVYLPLDGVIDVDAERARLDGQLQKGDKDIEALERRLSGGFREKAPANVVAEFEAKLAKSLDERERLQKARAMLG